LGLRGRAQALRSRLPPALQMAAGILNTGWGAAVGMVGIGLIAAAAGSSTDRFRPTTGNLRSRESPKSIDREHSTIGSFALGVA